jgi:transposase-like protein
MKRTPAEVRAAIVSAYRRGKMTQAQVAAQFGVTKFTVTRLVRLAREREAETFTKSQAENGL